MAVQHAYTLEEFEDFLVEHPNQLFELINGEIIEKMPTLLHGFIIAFLTTALMNYLRANPIGRAIVEGRYALPDDKLNDRIPDLSFITNTKGALVRKGAAQYMPDLAVEVQSPDQSDKLMTDKAAYYLAHGTRMVWLVYPEKRIVEVLTLDDRQLLNESATLSGGDVLPNFTLSVHEIFAE
jgi:Uma2 family endonuclease